MTLKAPKPTHLLASMGIASALLFTPGHAVSAQHDGHDHTAHQHAATPDFAKSALNRAQATAATTDFISAHKEWAQARGASNKAQALNNLIAKAEARREMLAELIKTNPAEALRVAIPDEKQLGMPTKVLEMLEQRFDTDGELNVFYEDYEDGSHKLRHFISTPFGERFELHFAGKEKAKGLLSGTRVNVNGLLLGGDDASSSGDIVIDEGEENILKLAADGGSTGGTNGGTEATLPNTFGEQSTLVILANYKDNVVEPWTKATVSNEIFGTVNDFIKENSSQQTSMSGNVYGWYTLPLNSTSCNDADITTAFEQVAQANGINLSAYSRHIFVTPTNPTCSWGGLGSVGGSPSKTIINGRMNWYTIAHEYGHNLGLRHAHAKDCGSSVLSDNCTHVEYGDALDVMASSKGHFGAYMKEQLGWLNVTEVNSSGIYSLAPFAGSASSVPKAIKVIKEVDSVYGTSTWYYLTYRKSVGFDSVFDANSNLQNGVVVHTGSERRSIGSYMLDMTPNSSSVYIDPYDPALTVGNSYSDSEASIVIDTLSVSDTIADVSISLTATPTCTQVNPSISLSPATQWAESGTQVTYTVTLTNNDGSNCASRSFSLNSNKPSGWSTYFGQSSAILVPGASLTTSLQVTSSSTAVDGVYNLSVSGSSGSNSATGTVTYVVDNPTANSAPNAYNDSASTSQDTPVTINVLANDSDPDGDTLTVTTLSGVNGSAKINSNGTITFTPSSGFSGTEAFNYSISDGNGGSDSASVSVNVTGTSNRAPVAVNDTVTLSSKTSVSIPVMDNDYDPENDSLEVSSVTQGAKGSVHINSNGTITYTPAKSFKNSDSFTYTIFDGDKFDTATVSITLQSDGGSTGGKGNGKKR